MQMPGEVSVQLYARFKSAEIHIGEMTLPLTTTLHDDGSVTVDLDTSALKRLGVK